MRAGLLLLLCVITQATTAAAQKVDHQLREAEPLLLLVLTPPSVASDTATSRFLDAADAALAERTSLEVIASDRVGVQTADLRACPSEGRVGCWLQTIQRASRGGLGGPRYLLVVGVLPLGEGRDQLNTLLLDLQTPGDAPEDVLVAAVERSPGTPVATASQDELRTYFSGLIERRFRGRLERSGHWAPHGTLDVVSGPPGSTIEIDGTVVGLTAQDRTRIAGLLPGTRTVVLRAAEASPVSAVVNVESGAVASVTLEPVREWAPSRNALRWTGIVTAAAGVGTLVYAAARQDGLRATCIVRPGADPDACPAGGGPSVGSTPTVPTVDPEALAPRGVLLVPLGAALLTAGGGWAAGAQWLGPPDEAPWWGVAIGVAAGVLTYAVGAALDPGGP